MEAAELPDLQVLVHCFSRCYCRSNTFSADHIKVRTLNRLVEPGQAVALSYGIGNFDRQKHLFGHVDGLEPEPELVRLEFGGEWEIQGLMDALVTLNYLSHRIRLLSRSICRTCHEFTASSRS
jgi:hypothetical protein